MVKIKKETWFMIMMVVSMLIWGGSWTSAKLISDKASSEVIIFYRFLITFLSFIPVILIKKPNLKINKTGIIQVVFGSLFLVSYNIFFFNGIKVGLAGAGGVIVTTLNPLFTFILAFFLFKQKGGIKEVIGISLGLFGGIILMEVWDSKNLLLSGNVFFLFAALSWALLSLFSQRSKTNMSPFVFSFYIYGCSSIVNFFLALPNGVFEVSNLGAPFWINILYISVGATTFATTAYFIATSKLGATKASSFTFLVPSSALFFSWIILKEVPSIFTIIGGLIALSAVYIINIKIRKKQIITIEKIIPSNA